MTGVTRVQQISMGIDSTESSTNRSQAYTQTIASGNYLLVLYSTRDSNPGNYTVQDNRSNTWTTLPNIYDSGGGRGVGGAYCLANAASVSGIPTVTINKNGTGGAVGATMFELNCPSGTFLDAVTPVAATASSTTGQVTLGATAYDHDAIFAVICTGPSSFTTLTPLTNYTSANSLSSATPAFQHAVVYRDTTTAAAFTPGWTLGTAAQWEVLGIAIKGTTTAPTITGVSTATPNYLGSLTITGVNFGATQGTGSVSLGGNSCTVLTWSDTSIGVTVARGTNGYGSAANLIVTINGGTTSNTSPLITAILPQVGWSYVTLGTPFATTANRLTASADIASGNQIAYNNQSGGVIVYTDATFSWGATPNSTTFEVWVSGSGWGTTALESFEVLTLPVLLTRQGLAKMLAANYTTPATPFTATINTVPVVGIPSSYAMQTGFTGTVTGQQWYRNTGTGPSAISSATSATYTPTSTDISVPTWLSVRGTTTLGNFTSLEFAATHTVISNASAGSNFTKHTISNVSAGYTALQPMLMRACIGTDYTTTTFVIDSLIAPGTYVAADFGDFTGHAGTPRLNVRNAGLAPPAVIPKHTTRATTATRPVYNTGTGFFVKNGAVYDSAGHILNIRGINQLHYTNGFAGILKSGANVIREFVELDNGWTTGPAPTKTKIFDEKLAVHSCPMPCANVNRVSFTATFAGNIMTVSAITFGYIAVGQHISGVSTATFNSPWTITAFGTGTGGTGTYYFNNTYTNATPITLTDIGTYSTGQDYPGLLLNTTQTLIDQGTNWKSYNDRCILNLSNEFGAASSLTLVGSINGTTLTVTSAPSLIHRLSQWQCTDGTVVQIQPWGGATSPGTGTGGTGTYTIDQSLTKASQTLRNCSWRETYKTAITMLRTAGFTMPLCIDAPGSGQDIGTLVADGQALHDFDPQHNIVLSLHIYGNGKPGAMDTFLNPMQAITDSAGTYGGPAFLLGEIGPGRDVNANGGNPTTVTPLECIAVAESRGFGWIAWAWDDNDLSSNNSDDNGYALVYLNFSGYGGTPPNRADLTTFGQQIVCDPYYGTLVAVPATTL